MNKGLQKLTGMTDLFQMSEGDPNIRIGMVDGPVDSSHQEFSTTKIKTIHAGPSYCSVTGSFACKHGTFVAGVMVSERSGRVPGICPSCVIYTRPVFCEARDLNDCPRVTTKELANAIHDLLGAGVKVINLSLGIAPSTKIGSLSVLEEAYDQARKNGTLIIAASGNHGKIGHNPLFNHSWVIPVAACDPDGKVLPMSNLSSSIGKRGLLAPGKDILSVRPGGGYGHLTGTSVATPVVSGCAALMWSLRPNASAPQIRSALLNTGHKRKSVVPPILNGGHGLNSLN